MGSKESTKRSVHYEGLYGQQGSQLHDYIFSESIKTRSRSFNWDINPHFHSRLFQFFLAAGGDATLYLNEMTIEIQAPFWVCIPPNFSHGFRFSAEVEGSILTFSTEYVKDWKALSNFPEEIIPTEVKWASAIPAGDFAVMQRLIAGTHEEIFNRQENREMALRLAIATLLLQVSRLETSGRTHAGTSDRNLFYFRRFIAQVRACQDPTIPLEQYASDLNISKGHLNRVCRAVKNASALQIVQEMMIVRAKAYLKHTDFNINEIAMKLRFNDPSYFTRWFRKGTGTTPARFRDEHFRHFSD